MKALERAGRGATSVWFRATLSNRPSVYAQSLPGTRRIPLRRGSEAATCPIGATGWPRDFQPRLWKFLNQADDRGRVIKQSIFEIENSVFNSLCLFLVRISNPMNKENIQHPTSNQLRRDRCWMFPCPSENCSFSAILISG